jgi:hypothetical protein
LAMITISWLRCSRRLMRAVVAFFHQHNQDYSARYHGLRVARLRRRRDGETLRPCRLGTRPEDIPACFRNSIASRHTANTQCVF